MKVTVVPSWKINTWSVKLSQGVQSFHLVYCGTKADATWYAKMFRKALSAHDAEKHKLLEATAVGHHRRSHNGACEPGCYSE
jgi:hypothetical protein